MPAPLFPGLDLLAGYRRLAIRVIELALRDLNCASPELRRSARTFLTADPLLGLWCDLAEIRPARVRARALQGPALPRRPGIRPSTVRLPQLQAGGDPLNLPSPERLDTSIADNRGAVERTMKAHRTRMMETMPADATADLVRMAGRLGLRPSH